MQTSSPIKEILIKSNKTFLLEYWNIFFYIYSNKFLEAFKAKNSKNYDKNVLESISLDDLLKNKKTNFIENNSIFINKINSEYSLSEQINKERNEDKKKIISDNKVHELYENTGEINEKLITPKLGFFSSSSLNNLGGVEGYPSFLYDPFNRQQSNNNFDSNLALNKFQPMSSSSFPNSINHPPSLNNLNMNKNIISNSGINQGNFLNVYNNYKSSNSNLIKNNSNNMLSINEAELCNKKTLLSPPPPCINNYMPPFLPKLTQTQNLLPNVNDKNINNITFSTCLNEKNILKENDKNSSTLNMFNKKRKRDIKNNKLVFILGDKDKDNKKEKKEKKEIKKQKIINGDEEKKENLKKNDENSEKNRKPRGSKFRGVSRNGNQWQVLIMVNKKKRYVGSYSKEEDAARAYDKVALQNHGSKAKTNFDYTKKEVEEILASPQLLKIN